MVTYPHLYQPPYRKENRLFGRDLGFQEQRVFESIPECLLVVDRDADIVCTNAEMERLFGFQPHEVVGGPIELLIAASQRQAYALQLQRFLESNSATPQCFEQRGLHKDGRDFLMEIRLGLLKKGRVVFVVNSFRDLTDRESLDEQGPIAALAGAGP